MLTLHMPWRLTGHALVISHSLHPARPTCEAMNLYLPRLPEECESTSRDLVATSQPDNGVAWFCQYSLPVGSVRGILCWWGKERGAKAWNQVTILLTC